MFTLPATDGIMGPDIVSRGGRTVSDGLGRLEGAMLAVSGRRHTGAGALRRAAGILLALLTILPATLAIGVVPAVAAGELTWRLENPFRFFRDPADTERLRRLFEEQRAELGRTPGVHEFEERLARWSGGWGWAEGILGDGPELSDRVAQEACWYRRERCSDYAHPTSHMVELRYVDQSRAGGLCTFTFGDRPPFDAECSRMHRLELPYPAGLAVRIEEGGQVLAEETVRVRDLMVVGMGDSFSSGEGNPDVPVRFRDNRVLDYDPQDETFKGYPPRIGDWTRTSDDGFLAADARWLHRPCHRSLYSQHVRLALHLALSDASGRTAVTYVGVACTGAEIVDGLFRAWSGVEPARAGETVKLSQISIVSQVLCSSWPLALSGGYPLAVHDDPEGATGARTITESLYVCPRSSARPIDVLLLSVGGNDAGFSRLVASAAIANDAILDSLAAAAGKTFKISLAGARNLARALPANYASLAKAIREVLHVDDPRRVHLTAYPPMAHDERGELCASGARGMDVTNMYRLDAARAAAAERFARDELQAIMARAAERAGWTFVDAHREVFADRGLCARGGWADDVVADLAPFPRRRRPAGAVIARVPESATAPAAEPTPRARVSSGFLGTAPDLQWQPFRPSAYRPYLPRRRWFRTPNDAFLTVNLHEGSLGTTILNLTRFSAYSGAFHPSAEGHAAIADAVFEAMRGHGLVSLP
ncbi:MAG: hypothetical protein GC150_10350 [Rhizobiales bacterium]|nr:hypothetical protein [Hyphomicrobiales bacterium]